MEPIVPNYYQVHPCLDYIQIWRKHHKEVTRTDFMSRRMPFLPLSFILLMTSSDTRRALGIYLDINVFDSNLFIFISLLTCKNVLDLS